MSLNFRTAASAAAITAAAFVAQGAQAASFYVDNVSMSWTNIQPGTVTNLSTTSGDPATMSWGSPLSAQSSYSFDANSPSGPWAEGALIDFGVFTHDNNPITGTTITSADLEFTFQVDAVAPITASSPLAGLTLSFTHNETPNNCTSSPDCSNDEVTATVSSGGGSFILGGLEYNFSVLGFSQDGGSTFDNTFSTVEGALNTANLYGTYTVSAVPLPAAAWMLLAGVGGLAAIGRRRKSA